MARTISVVKRAVSAWAEIFELPEVVWNPTPASCTDLSGLVKSLLGACPSSVEEERFAFQSIKKLLPPSCKCMEVPMLEDLADRLSRSPRELPPGYLKFVSKTVSHLFKKGWDSGLYERQALNVSPPLSATDGASRRDGGCFGLGLDHSSYLEAVLYGFEGEVSSSAEMLVVQSAGKPRPLTKFSADALLLRPLHGALYDHLSRFSWLCRGDPTAEKLKRAGFSEGAGLLVSGDYKSATDNLPLEVAEVALRVILDHAVAVPQSVKDYAKRILRPRLWSLDIGEDGFEFVPSVGQMMGSLLSFPLLCLQNYLAFRWSRHVAGLSTRLPLLVNGDDILFQSDASFASLWAETVSSVGLTVETTKTSVSESFGSLNSTLFRWSSGFLEVSPTLRFGMLRHTEYLAGIGRTFASFVRGIPSRVRYRAACCWFSYSVSRIRSSRLTLPELGFEGALAWRMGSKFGFPSTRTLAIPPKSPVGHNLILSSDSFSLVPAGSLGPEEREINAAEMVAWKWSVEFSECRVRSAIRYCLLLSQVRPVKGPDFSLSVLDRPLSSRFGFHLSRHAMKGWEWRRRFFPRVVREETEICADSLVFSQYYRGDLLPPYEEGFPPSYEDVEVASLVGGG